MSIATDRAEKLEKKIFRAMGSAIADFAMIEDQDKILVAVSGGKDSAVLLDLLQKLQARAPVRFELVGYHLDQGHPGFPVDVVREFLASRGLPFVVERQDTFTIVKETLEPGKTTCSLCSRLRRGILYNAAPRLGCNKIALGHHRDDSIETFLLNLFFSGRISAMPPKLLSDDGRNVIIRPLAYAAERDIEELARERGFPTVPCRLCDEQPDLKRRRVGELLDELEREIPNVRQTILRSMTDVRKSQLLDRKIFDFIGLRANRSPSDAVALEPPNDRGRRLPVIS